MEPAGTTIAAIEATLPWGLHDAYVEGLEVDWLRARLVLNVRVRVSERQDMDRRAKITVTGLAFCAIDAPDMDPAHGCDAAPEGGLWIDSGEGPGNREAKARMPEIPEGSVAARAGTGALFPGEQIDAPEPR